jgi:hypothetical protein
MAPPFKSVLELAAVAEVFGNLSVRVGEPHRRQRHTERGCRNLEHFAWSLAHLGAAVIDQHRSVFIDVHQAPAWLKAVKLKEIPNFTGVMASARFV